MHFLDIVILDTLHFLYPALDCAVFTIGIAGRSYVVFRLSSGQTGTRVDGS